MGQFCPVRGHGILARNSPDSHNIFIGPPVSHDSDAFDRQQNSKRLPEFFIITVFSDFFKQNCIRLSQYRKPFFSNFAKNPDSKPRARKRLSPYQIFMKTDFFAQCAYFVLEQISERFHKLEFHFFRKSAHIVMRFDHRRRSPECRKRFDNIRIQSSLCQKFRVFYFSGFIFKHIHKHFADDFPFLFRVSDSCQRGQKPVFGIHKADNNIKILFQRLFQLFSLVFTQKSVVHKDTGQIFPHSLVNKHCRDRRINAAAESENHLFVFHAFLYLRHCFFGKGFHCPSPFAPADICKKSSENMLAFGRMFNFRMKLNSVKTFFRMNNGCKFRVFRRSKDFKAFGNADH